MRKKIDKWIIITIVIGSIITIKLISINLVNFNTNIKLFSREVTNNIIKKRILDEVWDFEKVVKPDKLGYDVWIIGQESESVSVVKIASGVTVEPVFFNKEALKMDYNSIEEYDTNGGPAGFRKFIENKK